MIADCRLPIEAGDWKLDPSFYFPVSIFGSLNHKSPITNRQSAIVHYRPSSSRQTAESPTPACQLPPNAARRIACGAGISYHSKSLPWRAAVEFAKLLP
jgi:hypothetical protein